ncbi:12560_t:CDS:2 [Acaulospora colombiana]|uniref:12560_t:CDS:1 n=1 Tax=Acaulospora colombiana TaxID=27376 RepID=A0ACA9K313_9GLOM|nr:12560_t:CDS:2 [Acaulospora colombiana]
MFKQDTKKVVQGKQFVSFLICLKQQDSVVNSIFNHPKSMVDKEIKLFVQEFEVICNQSIVYLATFETNRNDREPENLKRCIACAQDSPDKYEGGISSLSKKLNDVSAKLKESRPVFENLLAELTELKERRKNIEDPYFEERREFLKEQDHAKSKLDEEFKTKEQELVNTYRLMMEEELRGTYDPIGGQKS